MLEFGQDNVAFIFYMKGGSLWLFEAHFFKSCYANFGSHELKQNRDAYNQNFRSKQHFCTLDPILHRRVQERSHWLWLNNSNRYQFATTSHKGLQLKDVYFCYQCPPSYGFGLDISTERCTFLHKLLLLSVSVWLSGNPRSKYWQFLAI